jgi:Endonuclease/Exonuclease/phosphatase family
MTKFKYSGYLARSLPLSRMIIICLMSSCGHQQPVASVASVASPNKICVQTFNAYGPAYSSNIPGRTLDLGEELLRSPCEILQVQELWTSSHHDLAVNAVRRSLPKLSATRFDDIQSPYVGQSGLAIFTSEILTDQSFSAFTINQDGLADSIRGMLGVIKGLGQSRITLKRDPAKIFQMMNLHTHPSSVRVRIAQIVQLLRRFESMLPLTAPVILTGDFNFKPDSVEYGLLNNVGNLTDSYRYTHQGYRANDCTYCAENPLHWFGESRVIDFIWLRSTANVKVTPLNSSINLRGIDDVVPSDHYGLRTQIDVREAAVSKVSQDIFDRRCRSAIASLDLALETLENNDATYGTYEWVDAQLRSYRSRFQVRDLQDPMVQQLLIP